MRPVSVVICCLFGLAVPSLFRISNFIKGLPGDLVKELESNEQQAGQFICQILVNGNIPGAIEDLGEDIWSDIEDDWSAVEDFIESLPTLAPEVLEDVIQDGEDVVSLIGELVTDPEAALTVIENGVETVVSDVESVAGGVYTFFKCLFGSCSSSTAADPAATLSSSCYAVLAAATTTYIPVTVASSTHAPAQTSYYKTLASATTATSETVGHGAAQSTTSQNEGQTVQQQQQQPTTTASSSGSLGSKGNRMPVVQAWASVLTFFIFVVVAL